MTVTAKLSQLSHEVEQTLTQAEEAIKDSEQSAIKAETDLIFRRVKPLTELEALSGKQHACVMEIDHSEIDRAGSEASLQGVALLVWEKCKKAGYAVEIAKNYKTREKIFRYYLILHWCGQGDESTLTSDFAWSNLWDRW